jgi:hypothetical protein
MTYLRHRCLRLIVLSLLAMLLLPVIQIRAQSPARSEISMATDDRLQSSGWWPTKGTPSREVFVGTAECARCHEKQALTYITTPMAQASAPAPYSQVLQTHDHLSTQRPPYRYELSRNAAIVTYSVTKGSSSLTTTLAWAFGLGHKGQTYLFQRKAAFYESHLSFYNRVQGLELTTGHEPATPEDIESALGRRMDADETRRCFACHASGSTIANRFDPTHVTPGVTCEACHGPGAKHVAAMKSGKIDDGRRASFNPGRLSPIASVDFCGACHRTWADVLQGGFTGVINARFQPYRLESSLCWQALKGDARLTCTACHDPHQQLDPDAASYDQNCLSCHVATLAANSASDHAAGAPKNVKSRRDRYGAACPVSTNNCVSCHMPQVELPTMHATFTDHRIRIVREGQPYPN